MCVGYIKMDHQFMVYGTFIVFSCVSLDTIERYDVYVAVLAPCAIGSIAHTCTQIHHQNEWENIFENENECHPGLKINCTPTTIVRY